MHARSALWTFVGDNHHVAGFNLVVKDAFNGVVLAFEYFGFAGEVEYAFVDAGSLHHAAVVSDVAVEHCQTTVFHIGVFEIANAAFGAVGVEFFVVA